MTNFEDHYEFWRPWNKIKTEIRHFMESVCRFFYWGWKMRMNYDWDYTGIYEMLVYKLDRMIPLFEKNEFHCYSKKFIRKMKIIRSLAYRLSKSDYSRNYDAHNDTWGHSEYRFKANKDGLTSQMIFIDPPKVNDKNRKRYMESAKKATLNDNAEEVEDRILMFNMISKYIPKWWD